MTNNTNVLITGVSRGIGRALAEAYLSRPNHTVIGTLRSLSSPAAAALQAAPRAAGSRLILAKLEVTSASDYTDLATHLTATEGITHLDVVISNAGVTGTLSAPAGIDTAELLDVFDTNVVGPIRLFQAVLPLLQRSPAAGGAKWVSVSTVSSSIDGIVNGFGGKTAGYGLTKAALNFATRAIHAEHDDVVALALHPGWVRTEMGNAGAAYFGLPQANLEIDEAVPGILKVIDNATKEDGSGKFIGYDGSIIPW